MWQCGSIAMPAECTQSLIRLPDVREGTFKVQYKVKFGMKIIPAGIPAGKGKIGYKNGQKNGEKYA
jgi:hypothetical protein